MGFIDEKFALLEKAKRQMEKEEKLKEELSRQEEDIEISIEDIRGGIRKKELDIKGETLYFKQHNFFEDKLTLSLIEDFFDGVKEDKQFIMYGNNEKGICVMCTYLSDSLPVISLEQRIEEMKENFAKIKAYVEIIKTVELEYLDYLCYRTPTSKGWVYNIIFWAHKDERRIVGNLNCLEKDIKTYGLLLEGMLLESHDALY